MKSAQVNGGDSYGSWSRIYTSDRKFYTFGFQVKCQNASKIPLYDF